MKVGGTPPALLEPAARLVERKAKITAEQYNATREAAEVSAAEADAARALEAAYARERELADSEGERQLEALNKEIARETDLPARGLATTDSEYAAALQRRSIQETQRLRSITGAALDAELIRGSDDAATIGRVIEESFMRGDADVIRRLVPLAQSRLRTLARLEAKRNGTPGIAAKVRPIEAAIETKYEAWLAAEAARSPVARRAQIVARTDRTLREIDRHYTTIREKFLGPKGVQR